MLLLPPAANCTGQNSGEISQVISKTWLSTDKLVDWSPNLIHFYTSTKFQPGNFGRRVILDLLARKTFKVSF